MKGQNEFPMPTFKVFFLLVVGMKLHLWSMGKTMTQAQGGRRGGEAFPLAEQCPALRAETVSLLDFCCPHPRAGAGVRDEAQQ